MSLAEPDNEKWKKLKKIELLFWRIGRKLNLNPREYILSHLFQREYVIDGRWHDDGRYPPRSILQRVEESENEPLDFLCTIMVLGKTGVGKSATINSIFDEAKCRTDAFQICTEKVQDIVGTVRGIKVRIIDTPGLLPSPSDQRQNEKILNSVKSFFQTPPDILLYVDRVDMITIHDFSDLPLLHSISKVFGEAIWSKAILVLTHAATLNGANPGYEFVSKYSEVFEKAVCLEEEEEMLDVCLVENSSICPRNKDGERVLADGNVWEAPLLMNCFARKLLAETKTLLNLEVSRPEKPFGMAFQKKMEKPFATRSQAPPPLPVFLSFLLQSKSQVKLHEVQFCDDVSGNRDSDESSDFDDDGECVELSPFKRFKKHLIAMLIEGQPKSSFGALAECRDEEKQLKEEKRQWKVMKKAVDAAKDLLRAYGENAGESGPAALLPLTVLSLDNDKTNTTLCYRYLDSSNQLLVRPVLETHGWDHNVGYQGIDLEASFIITDPMMSISAQVVKDKTDAIVQMELTTSTKHREAGAASVVVNMQTVGKDLAYTLLSETSSSNLMGNSVAAGFSVSLLGDSLLAGMKVGTKLISNGRLDVTVSGGAMTGLGDIAYGGSLQAHLRDKGFPMSSLVLSFLNWHGDLAVGCSLHSEIPVGRSIKLIADANLNSRGRGKVGIRLNITELLQLAFFALAPMWKKLRGNRQ